MSGQLPNIKTLLQMLKGTYLDNRDIGIRRFAEMTNIRRTRLQQLFDGKKTPTDLEVTKISTAMDVIESQFAKAKELREKNKFKEEMNKTFKELLETTKK